MDNNINNVAFKSNIKIVSPKRFEKISHKLFAKNAELIDIYEFNNALGDPYRTNMTSGFTNRVRSCTAGLVASKDKKAPLFMHLFNNETSIKYLDRIKNFFHGTNCILIGSKKCSPHSTQVFDAVENIAVQSQLPVTKMKGLSPRFEADIAYNSKNDTMFLCVKDAFNHNSYAETEDDLRLLFDEVQVSEKDKIFPLKSSKEFFKNMFNL